MMILLCRCCDFSGRGCIIKALLLLRRGMRLTLVLQVAGTVTEGGVGYSGRLVGLVKDGS